MTLHWKLSVLAPLAVLLTVVPATQSPAAGPSLSKSETGKRLYRKYCGQCHALKEALAAGFGSDKGLGNDGGPSFNNLKVPYTLSIGAVNEDFGGHELVVKKMPWQELTQVATFVASATKNHPRLAKKSDG